MIENRQLNFVRDLQRGDPFHFALGCKIAVSRQRKQVGRGQHQYRRVSQQDHEHRLGYEQQQERQAARQQEHGQQRPMRIDALLRQDQQHDGRQHGQQHHVQSDLFGNFADHRRGTSTVRMSSRRQSSTSRPSTSASAVKITRCRRAGNATWATSSGIA